MKYSVLLIFAILFLNVFSCKKQDNIVIVNQVSGKEAIIDWQGCAFYTDYDLRVCVVNAVESRCACNVECSGGNLFATLQVTTPALDTTITLIAENGSPENQVASMTTISGKTIHLINANLVTMDCIADHGNLEKYQFKVIIDE